MAQSIVDKHMIISLMVMVSVYALSRNKVENKHEFRTKLKFMKDIGKRVNFVGKASLQLRGSGRFRENGKMGSWFNIFTSEFFIHLINK
jgi:hypothetical protein